MIKPEPDREKVSALLLRALTTAEAGFLPALWDMAWTRAVASAPCLAAGTDPAPDIVVDVIAGIVARVFRNPEGFRSETDGDYSYTLLGGDPTRLDPTDDEIDLMCPGSQVFSVVPMPLSMPPDTTSTGTP